MLIRNLEPFFSAIRAEMPNLPMQLLLDEFIAVELSD